MEVISRTQFLEAVEVMHKYIDQQNDNLLISKTDKLNAEKDRIKAIFDNSNKLIADFDLANKSRKREQVTLRQVAMWFIYENTNISQSNIGYLFKRDHATVINSLKVVDAMIKQSDFEVTMALGIIEPYFTGLESNKKRVYQY